MERPEEAPAAAPAIRAPSSKGASESNGASGSNGAAESIGAAGSNGASESNGASGSNGAAESNGTSSTNAQQLRTFESADGSVRVVQAENLAFLRGEPDDRYRLIYVDPPFNTGSRRELRTVRVERDPAGDRVGFAGARYRTTEVARAHYDDRFDDYAAFLAPRLAEARRVLAADGSLFVHLDPRESHYVKVMLDGLFGRACFVNEIVWAYDYGGRTRSRWPAKHDVILWYAKDPARRVFRYDDVDRIPYMAPRLVGAEKARRGKTPTDVWWQTIVPTGGRERTGYPTQKPLAILERIVRVHSDPGDLVLDFFAGSGTTGAAAALHGRRAVLVDESAEAVRVMRARLGL